MESQFSYLHPSNTDLLGQLTHNDEDINNKNSIQSNSQSDSNSQN